METEIAPKTILVMEDDYLVRQALVRILERLQYRTIEAPDGEAGLEQLHAQVVDLVLIDLVMPVMSGYDVIPLIAREFPELPVIVCSGADSGKDVIFALQLGAWEYIIKPVTDIGLLQHTLKRGFERAIWLRDQRTREEELQRDVEARTAELRKQTEELAREVETRKRAESEVSELNRELEMRVEERTFQLQEVNHELNETLRKLKEDEIAGRKIQFQLLPPPQWSAAGYEFNHYLLPSTFLSGDFLDYFSIGETHLGFYIADVSGHGVSSAFVTVFLKSFVSTQLRRYQEIGDTAILHPCEMLRRLNREILDQKIDKYLTIFYAVIELATNTMTFCNGGQFPFPILVHGSQITKIAEKGFPVGMLESSVFEDAELQLPPDFTLYLVSDGILDLLPETDNLSQRDDLLIQHLLAYNDTISDLSERIGQTLGKMSDDLDDITFLCVKRRSETTARTN